ncbi:MAG: hypothetical protein JKY89_10610, partial [Immundisolibacteraceae bacterium]|nr:hypothetical protein [Immundisolibacteraceae bacterium]
AITSTNDLLIKAVGATSDITLAALATSISQNVSLNAGRNIIQSAGGNISAQATTKTIDLLAVYDITAADTTSINANDGDIRLDAGHDIILELIDSGTANTVLIAVRDITDGDTDVDILANHLILTAGSGIASGSDLLDITVATLAASAAADGIFIKETNAIIVSNASVTINRVSSTATTSTVNKIQEDLTTSSNGAIVLTATDIDLNGGNVDATTSVTAAGTGHIFINATSGNIDVNSKIDAGAGHLSLLASANITQAASGDIVSTVTSTIDIEATAGSISMSDGATTNTGSGNIRYLAGTSLTLGALTTTGDVSLIATDISDSGTTDQDITADELRVLVTGTGGFGTSANHMETTIAKLSANVKTDGLFVTETNALTIDTLSIISVNRVSTDGTTLVAQIDAAQSDVVSTGAIVVQTTSGVLIINGGGDTDAISATGNILLKTSGTSDLTINARVQSSAGNISINSSKDVIQTASGNIQTDANLKTIDVLASNNITMTNGSFAKALGNANIRYEALSGNVTIATINAGTSDVTIKANGSILDGGDSDVDILGTNLRLNASSEIGSSTNGIETTVTNLSAKSSSGSMYLIETDALIITKINSLSVNRVATDATSSAKTDGSSQEDLTTLSNGHIIITATDITVNGGNDTSGISANGTGHVLLKSTVTDISLNASLNAGTGSVSIIANRTVNQSQNITTSSTGTIDVEALTGAIVMTDSSLTQTIGKDVSYKAKTNITLGGILTSGATFGHVSLVAEGSIIDGGDTLTDIIAGGLIIQATNAIGTSGNLIDTSIVTLSTISGAGGTYINETDALIISNITTVVNRVKLDQSLETSANTPSISQTDVTTSTGNIDFRATSITLNEGSDSDNLAIQATATATITLNASSGDITQNTNVSSNTGAISYTASNDIVLAANTSITSNAGAITFNASSDVLMNTGSSLDATSAGNTGTISITAATDVTTYTLLADSTIGITATAGLILNNHTITSDLGTITQIAKTTLTQAVGANIVVSGAAGNISLTSTDNKTTLNAKLQTL